MTQLTLSDVTDIAEIVGSIGIIVSLIFVGLQIRQNTRQIEVSSLGSGFSFFQALNELMTNPETSELVLKGVSDFGVLSKAEKARFNGVLLNVLMKFFMARQFYLQGSLNPREYDGCEVGLARLMLSPGVITWWAEARRLIPDHSRGVIDEVTQRHRDVEPTSDYHNFAPRAE